jgi:hypothetical protein
VVSNAVAKTRIHLIVVSRVMCVVLCSTQCTVPSIVNKVTGHGAHHKSISLNFSSGIAKINIFLYVFNGDPILCEILGNHDRQKWKSSEDDEDEVEQLQAEDDENNPQPTHQMSW